MAGGMDLMLRIFRHSFDFFRLTKINLRSFWTYLKNMKLSWILFISWYDIRDIMTGAACGAGKSYPSRAPYFTSGFYRGSCCPVICVSSFHIFVFGFWVVIVCVVFLYILLRSFELFLYNYQLFGFRWIQIYLGKTYFNVAIQIISF